MDPATLTGVVLAGGLSRRLGRDKARLVLDGASLAERIVAVLGAVFPRVLVVARDERQLAGLPLPRVIFDEVPGIGPLGGLHAGLKQLEEREDAAGFFAACDLPRLDAGLIRRQLEVFSAAGEKVDAVVPVSPAGREPLHAVYRRGCLAAVEAQIEKKRYRLHELLERLRVHYWEVGAGEARAFFNINTQEDLRRLT